MLYQETNKHWEMFSSTVAFLISHNRRDPLVLALLAAESFFRPTIHLFFESIYWILMDMFNSNRADYISVGISQVQIRHWRAAGIISCSTSRFSSLLKIYNPLLNYDACKSLIGTTNYSVDHQDKILDFYTGKTTRYHKLVFNNFLGRAKQLSPPTVPINGPNKSLEN